MDMNQADILTGRAKSVSARHYALYEFVRLIDTYIQCWESLGVGNGDECGMCKEICYNSYKNTKRQQR